MRKSSIFNRAALIAVLCTGVTGRISAQYATPPPAQQTQTVRDQAHQVNPGEPLKANRASGLIGMQVKNQEGEQLGKIKDIVFDLTGDRVSYLVLANREGLLGAEKFHAVPMRAFLASPDGTYLILHADKEKLARAEGFDHNNWPSVTSPSWGAEPFWQETTTPSTQQPVPLK